jgi:hypothetical protein
VNGRPPKDGHIYGEVGPTKGVIYTIRALHEVHGVRLAEIVNGEFPYQEGVMECYFDPDRFRPIAGRKTDISFAHEILHAVSRKETVRA